MKRQEEITKDQSYLDGLKPELDAARNFMDANQAARQIMARNLGMSEYATPQEMPAQSASSDFTPRA